MHNLPFDKPGRFFRGNLHAHTTRSDGTKAPAEVVAAYRAQGYDFLAVTDHFMAQYGWPITDTRDLRTPDFTTLLGAELHAPATANGMLWELVAAGLPPDFAPPAAHEDGPALAARAAEAGAFVGLAHPAWYGLTLADALTIEAAHAVEVYNEICAHNSDRGDSWYLCDQLLAHGRRVTAFAADDVHYLDRPDRFGGWVWARADRLEPEALVTALKAGHYYASQGPLIHGVEVAGEQLAVACSPARAIFLGGDRAAGDRRIGPLLTEAEFDLARFQGGYCRVTVVDAAGKRAWTNPIWLD